MNDTEKTGEALSRVLIVDDEPLIRKILSKYLKEKNFIIETADNGKDALEKLKEQSFDLVLTDLRMPKMGGRELLQLMADDFPEIPKIVLTGYGTNDDIIIALQTGAYDFLTKPITDFKILEHSIDRAIERKKLNDERKHYLSQLQRINEIVSLLNKGKSTEDIFKTLNVTLREIIPYDRFTLSLILKQSNFVITKLVASEDQYILNSDKKFSLDESMLKTVSQEMDVLNIDNLTEYYTKYPDSASIKMLIDEGMNSSIVLPLIVSDMTRGFLIFASKKYSAFKTDHITFLESIVGNISFSIERGELIDEIEEYTKRLEKTVDIRTKEIIKTQKTTVFALSKIAEARDSVTGYHLERMRNHSVLLAQILKYSGKHDEITNQYLRDLYDSSILHDIGKVGIPDSILLKEDVLTENEITLMHLHTSIGYEALRSASQDLGEDSFLKMAMEITLCHHERWDGSGYPNRLKGEEIPLAARIVAIADVYDALTSDRPYKVAYSHEDSIEIMKKESQKFAPDLFEIFYENSEEFNKIRLRFAEK